MDSQDKPIETTSYDAEATETTTEAQKDSIQPDAGKDENNARDTNLNLTNSTEVKQTEPVKSLS